MKEFRTPDRGTRIRLETWGEIAGHLGVEVRTAQRWEQRIGLPVRRLDGGQAVYAFVDEIDAWRQAREVTSASAEAMPALAPPVIAPTPSSPQGSLRYWVWTVMTAGLVLTLVALTGPPVRTTAAEPAGLGLEGSRLVAVGTAGNTLWTYTFEAPTSVVDASFRNQMKKWWNRLDTDGDGVDEFAVVVGHANSGDTAPRDTLYVFTLEGQLRYRYAPEFSLSFGQQRFDPPWQIMDVEAVPADKQLWLSLANSPWWPAAVVSLDGTGHAALRYTQPGVVHVLRQMVRDNHTLVVAAGVNNEHASASLAVIDPARPPARAPANGVARYRCENCPDGAPEQYVLLRPSAANAIVNLPYNRADGLSVDASGIAVTTSESDVAAVIYRLSADLEPQSARPSDTFWVVIDQSRANGGSGPLPAEAKVDLWTRKGWTSRLLRYADVPTAEPVRH